MFDSDSYEVRQKLGLANKYNIYENSGGEPEHILQAKQKMLKLKEDFKFKDPETDEVQISVTTDSVIDYKATYTIIDERTDEIIGAVEQKSSGMWRQKWALLETDDDGQAEQVATVTEDSHLKALIRRQVTGLLPVAFNVEEASKKLSKDGQTDVKREATVRGAFSFRDKYDIEIESDDLDPRLVVVGAVLIDAIEGN